MLRLANGVTYPVNAIWTELDRALRRNKDLKLHVQANGLTGKPSYKVNDQRNHADYKQQVNQCAGDVE